MIMHLRELIIDLKDEGEWLSYGWEINYHRSTAKYPVLDTSWFLVGLHLICRQLNWEKFRTGSQKIIRLGISTYWDAVRELRREEIKMREMAIPADPSCELAITSLQFNDKIRMPELQN